MSATLEWIRFFSFGCWEADGSDEDLNCGIHSGQKIFWGPVRRCRLGSTWPGGRGVAARRCVEREQEAELSTYWTAYVDVGKHNEMAMAGNAKSITVVLMT
ncbi:unnamed protein product [Cuscuta epithymum]|uniref:Uncharacterized protein n=1 Tax=Cuscuta epithymum TaxID=186058 RepID=A0AAV0EHX6_9ASTE|nr:unnamed protein product [Cuscuta epithymum]